MVESVPAGCFWVQSPAGQRQIPRGTALRPGRAAGNLANRCSEPVLLRRQIFPGLLFPLVFRWRCWLEDVEGVWRRG